MLTGRPCSPPHPDQGHCFGDCLWIVFAIGRPLRRTRTLTAIIRIPITAITTEAAETHDNPQTT